MKISQIVESSAGATASGSVASVAMPIGKMEARTQKPPKAPKVIKGKKYANTISEGAIKSIATDMDQLSDAAFKKKYGKSKEEMRKALKEEKIEEADLIVMPGMRRMKDTSFIPHKADRRDHEVEMARSDLYAAAKDAMRIFKLLKDRSEEDGLMGWQQSYITLAADYLNSVADSIEYNAKVKGSLDEMTGGVLAGGMSNFEEDAVTELSPQTKKSYSAAAKLDKKYNDNNIDKAKRMSQEQPHKKAEWEDEIEFLKSVNAKRDRGLNRAGVAEGHADQQRKVFKKNGKPVGEVGIDRESSPGVGMYYMKHYASGKDLSGYDSYEEAVAELKHCLKQGVAEDKCPKCGGEMVSEELMNEKKDACYYKVKSRYKVWPSAYASGALVKCRKKGASNWGKSKK